MLEDIETTGWRRGKLNVDMMLCKGGKEGERGRVPPVCVLVLLVFLVIPPNVIDDTEEGGRERGSQCFL